MQAKQSTFLLLYHIITTAPIRLYLHDVMYITADIIPLLYLSQYTFVTNPITRVWRLLL